MKCGDGLVIDAVESSSLPEQGGRVYELVRNGRDFVPSSKQVTGGLAEIRFGRNDVDLRKIRSGQSVWKTDDPELTRRLRKTFEGAPHKTIALDFDVTAETGKPLVIEARTATGLFSRVESDETLVHAERLAASEELFQNQLGRLGGSIYHLGSIAAMITGAPLVPKSLLNGMRRQLVESLEFIADSAPTRTLTSEPVLPRLKAAINALIAAEPRSAELPKLSVLCRTTAQIQAALAQSIQTIYAEYQDIKEYKHAVEAVRRGRAEIFLATPRIEKPFEGNLFKFLAKLGADGILVRNAGGIEFCNANGIPFVADFSMNAANELTVELLKSLGALRVTASYDLNVDQLDDLLTACPKEWLEVVIHQQIPMFHMGHCVYCAFLSPGTNETNCGRPCDKHDVKLRDRTGVDHPLKADVGCRNTLYNGTTQSAVEYLPRLISHGARHLRIEFLDDEPATVVRTIGVYRDVLDGKRDARNLWRELRATGKYGVTRGSLNVL